jgi:K+/H+ antiporter YhaU regulatory subunit KhtT
LPAPPTCFTFRRLLGESLAGKTLGIRVRENIIGAIDSLLIAETPVMRTPLEGKSLAECRIRRSTGCNVVGVDTGGKMNINPEPGYVFVSEDKLFLVGSDEAQRQFLEAFPT